MVVMRETHAMATAIGERSSGGSGTVVGPGKAERKRRAIGPQSGQPASSSRHRKQNVLPQCLTDQSKAGKLCKA
jgi:hypothetical protein